MDISFSSKPCPRKQGALYPSGVTLRGHQALFLNLAETGPLLLPGDLYHFRLSRTERRVPRFNVDAEMTLQSMERVEAFVAEVGATLWIEHDHALFEELDKVPTYYE